MCVVQVTLIPIADGGGGQEALAQCMWDMVHRLENDGFQFGEEHSADSLLTKCLERVPKCLEKFQHFSGPFQNFSVAFKDGSAELT